MAGKPNGINPDILRAMYAEQFANQKAEIERLRTRIDNLERQLAAAHEQIAEYKNVVFKTQMKLDAAETRAAE